MQSIPWNQAGKEKYLTRYHNSPTHQVPDPSSSILICLSTIYWIVGTERSILREFTICTVVPDEGRMWPGLTQSERGLGDTNKWSPTVPSEKSWSSGVSEIFRGFFFLKHWDRCLRNIKELASLGSEQKNSLGIIWELRVFGGTQVRCSFLNLSVQKNKSQGRAMNVTWHWIVSKLFTWLCGISNPCVHPLPIARAVWPQ